MHLLMVCPTYPTCGLCGGKMGVLSLWPVPKDGARWGICQHCALNRIIEGQSSLGICKVPRASSSTTASKKTVAVQFGKFNRVIQLDCTCSDVSERGDMFLFQKWMKMAMKNNFWMIIQSLIKIIHIQIFAQYKNILFTHYWMFSFVHFFMISKESLIGCFHSSTNRRLLPSIFGRIPFWIFSFIHKRLLTSIFGRVPYWIFSFIYFLMISKSSINGRLLQSTFG